jgi:hypothetical protein
LINYSFTFATIGQTSMAIGQPFIINAVVQISANWFPENERIIATSVAISANIFGSAIGAFVPSIFFTDDDIKKPVEAKQHCFDMNLSLAVFSAIVLLLSVLFLKDKPE